MSSSSVLIHANADLSRSYYYVGGGGHHSTRITYSWNITLHHSIPHSTTSLTHSPRSLPRIIHLLTSLLISLTNLIHSSRSFTSSHSPNSLILIISFTHFTHLTVRTQYLFHPTHTAISIFLTSHTHSSHWHHSYLVYLRCWLTLSHVSQSPHLLTSPNLLSPLTHLTYSFFSSYLPPSLNPGLLS